MWKREISRTRRILRIEDYENKLAANVKSDSKSFYKYVRSRQRKKDMVEPIIDNQILIKDEEVAEAINKFWVILRKGRVASTMFKGGDEHKLRDVTFTKERELEKGKTMYG